MCCSGDEKSRSCPQWPDKCCLCFSRRGGVVLTGILTVLDSICVILLCGYAIARQDFWAEGYRMVENWVLNNQWDTEVSHYALVLLGSVNANRRTLLSATMAYACLAILNSLLMMVGVCLQSRGRRLLLPWLLFDFLTISVTVLVFVISAFLSFFVHVLIAILFPVFAGAILGLHIYLWRNVKDVYLSYAELEEPTLKLVVGGGHNSSTYTMLNANTGSRRHK